MYIGLNVLHNATAAVASSDQIIFAQSEERFNRIKNSSGLPRLTLNYIYQNIVNPKDVQAIVIYMEQIVFLYESLKKTGFKSSEFNYTLNANTLSSAFEQVNRFDSREDFKAWATNEELSWTSKEQNETLRKAALEFFSDNLGIHYDKIVFANHHLTHAYSVIPNLRERLTTSCDTGLIFTLDGQGDLICGSVGIYSPRTGYSVLCRVPRVQSIGRLYHLTTGYLGMKMAEDEHKVMGLAAYSKPAAYLPILSELKELIWITDDGEWDSAFCCREDCLAMLHSTFHLKRFDAIAGAVQQLVEELVTRWIKFWIRKTGVSTIACAGGVFMNVKANQRIADLAEVKKVFFMPSAGDESSAIGAAIYGAESDYHPTKVKPLRSAYLGVEFTDDECEEAINISKAHDRHNVIYYGDTANSQVAQLLADKKVVARFAGRMEFGARALGNRSILANPTDLSVVSFINAAIKSRDFWMPFAPSILEEDFQSYVYDNGKQKPLYMMSTYDCTDLGKRSLIAAMHQTDLTIRPQVVTLESNRDYHNLIDRFKLITGIGALLNTSFNLHGEPVVCTPTDAISTFERSGLQYLQIGKFLISKKSS